MMCLCEYNLLESRQVQIGEKERLSFIWLHVVHNIACVMLQNKFFERTCDGCSGNHSVSLPIILIKIKVDQMLPS